MVVDSNLKNRPSPTPLSKNPIVVKTRTRRGIWPKSLFEADVNSPPKIATTSPTGNRIDPAIFLASTLLGRGIHERPRRDTVAPAQPSQ